MKCFIHVEKEAVAACRKCGKGMCENCSAYTGHVGICPECKKKEFEAEKVSKYNELNQKSSQLESRKLAKVGWIIFTALLFWTIVGLFYGLYRIYGVVKELKALNDEIRALSDRISYLTQEIDKLNDALARRSTNATI